MHHESRFWAKVRKTHACWVWTAARFSGRNGKPKYGMFAVDKVPVKAHRFSYEMHFGPIPEGMHVLHKCDNYACVRPDHLWLGTPLLNNQDMVRKGRAVYAPRPAGEASVHHVLSERQVRAIRKSSLSQRALASVYGVGKTTIHHVLKHDTWKRV